MYFLLTDSVSVAEIARVMMPAGAGSEMISRFELRRSAAGGYYFMLLTDSNAVIATSEMHAHKESALIAIRVMKRIAIIASIDDRTGP